jgi:predicted nucleic acid-binding protein
MVYLFDTNAFSDLMREHPKLDARLAKLPPTDRVVVCTVVRGEIQYGLARLPAGKRRRELTSKADRLFAILPCEPIPESAGDCYAETKLARERHSLALDENDLWIAATARALGAVLVSRDTGFSGVDGLTVEDWTT